MPAGEQERLTTPEAVRAYAPTVGGMDLLRGMPMKITGRAMGAKKQDLTEVSSSDDDQLSHLIEAYRVMLDQQISLLCALGIHLETHFDKSPPDVIRHESCPHSGPVTNYRVRINRDVIDGENVYDFDFSFFRDGRWVGWMKTLERDE